LQKTHLAAKPHRLITTVLFSHFTKLHPYPTCRKEKADHRRPATFFQDLISCYRPLQDNKEKSACISEPEIVETKTGDEMLPRL